MDNKHVIAILLGDAAGVWAEIVAKTLAFETAVKTVINMC